MQSGQIKYHISACAIQLWLKQNKRFTINQLLELAKIDASTFFEHFNSKKDALRFFYIQLPLRLEAMLAEIPDFDSYTLSEKLNTVSFSIFDMLDEQKDFVAGSFQEFAGCTAVNDLMANSMQPVFERVFSGDPQISNSISFFLSRSFCLVYSSLFSISVRNWIRDESPGKEYSIALTDKWNSFVQEALYTKVFDSAFDLGKYIFSHFRSRYSQPLKKDPT